MMAIWNADEIIRDVKEAVNEEVRDVGLRILSAAINASPVGNPKGGHYRRNWQVGLLAAPNREIEGVDASGSATLAAGKSKIRSYRNGRLFITNNVPYANRIENGHSRQAPQGVLRGAVAVGLASAGKGGSI